MIRRSLMKQSIIPPHFMILPWYRTRCRLIAISVMTQCILVYIGSTTILTCVWSPDMASLDYDKLTRIMYLYDYKECGYRLRTATALSSIRLPNDTFGLNVKPIKWKQAIVTVSTRLSSKTRKYIELSLGIHVLWNIAAIVLHAIVKRTKNEKVLKITFIVFFYISLTVIIFDISMAIVYVADIQQSLTKGMILRYSGWSVELKLKSYDDFAGWLPLSASILWMRGILILAWNIYCCKFINFLLRKMRKKDVTRRLMREGYLPIPEPDVEKFNDKSILYYRTAVISIVVGWLTLSCRMEPSDYELREVTLMKLLYLYDPDACERIYFYNYTRRYPAKSSTIIWPVYNRVAADFRLRIRVSLSLHILWAVLGLVYVTQGQRACGMYATLLPFTITGAALLVLDVVYTFLFLTEAQKTSTEQMIIDYISLGSGDVRAINKTLQQSSPSIMLAVERPDADTSWIALLFAFISCRAVVQWFINFWIVKDNYLEGLEYYHRSLRQKNLHKPRGKRTSKFARIQ